MLIIHNPAIPPPIKLYVALRVGVAVILSQSPTPGTIEYFTIRFCGETYVLAGLFKSQVFKLCFGAKSFVPGKTLSKLRKEEDRRSQPAPTMGPTAPTVGPMQVSVHGEIFNFSWRVAKSVFWVRQCDGETWKKKERTKEKKDCGQRQREKISLIFSGLRLWRRKSTIVYTWYEEFLMQSTLVFMCCQVCLCVIERTIGVWTSVKVLYHERDRENGPLFQCKLCVAMVFRFAQRRPSDRCRWSSNDLCFSLWKNSDTRSPPLRRDERLHGLFFLVWEQFLSVEVIEEEKKASKRQSSSFRWIEESRKKKSSSALDTRSKIDQTQGRASRAIDRAPAPERPRLRCDLRNRRPGSPWY